MFKKLDIIEAIGFVIIIMISHILLSLPIGLIANINSSTPLNIIYISCIILLFFLLVLKILKEFPNKDLLDIAKFLGGNFLKIILGSIFIIYFLITISFLVRGFSEGLHQIYFPTYQISSIILFFLICSIILSKFGFNTVIKINLIIIPFILSSMLIIFFATADEFEVSNLFPLFGSGPYNTFIYGLSNIYIFGDIAILYFLPPYLSNCKALKKVGIWSIILSSIYLFLAVTSIILLFSTSYSNNMLLSLFNSTKKVEFGNFFRRTDALFILLWILSIFSYTSILVAFSAEIFKKIFNIQDKMGVVSSLTAIIFSISLLPTNTNQLYFYENVIYKYLVLGLIFIFSFLILLFAFFKKKLLNTNENINKNIT